MHKKFLNVNVINFHPIGFMSIMLKVNGVHLMKFLDEKILQYKIKLSNYEIKSQLKIKLLKHVQMIY